ncbi:hypothetical protein ACJX0J_037395, partial [Zea mays]
KSLHFFFGGGGPIFSRHLGHRYGLPRAKWTRSADVLEDAQETVVLHVSGFGLK